MGSSCWRFCANEWGCKRGVRDAGRLVSFMTRLRAAEVLAPVEAAVTGAVADNDKDAIDSGMVAEAPDWRLAIRSGSEPRPKVDRSLGHLICFCQFACLPS